jgi:hypothetical protein
MALKQAMRPTSRSDVDRIAGCSGSSRLTRPGADEGSLQAMSQRTTGLCGSPVSFSTTPSRPKTWPARLIIK